MIDVTKCVYEESHYDLENYVHYFTYPKDLDETEFYAEEDYGNVVGMCISLTDYGNGESTLQMSPTIEDEGFMIDVDWRDLYEGINYSAETIQALYRLVAGR